MRVNAKINCPGCGLSTPVTFKRPHVVQATVVQYLCGSCGSDILARVIPAPGNREQVQVRAKLQRASELLVRMKAEEAEFNAKEPEP